MEVRVFESLRRLALSSPQLNDWGLGSAADPIPLPQPEPRAACEHFVVPPIRSREIAQARRSVVRHREDALQPLDFGDGLLDVHPSQYLTETRGGQFGSGISKDRDCAIRPWPVDPPAPARCWQPEQFLWRHSPRMMVESSGPAVEPASVPRIVKPELLIIEMMAELVAQGAQECPEGSDFLPHRRSHPHADQHGFGRVVAEKLRAPTFAYSQWSGCKDSDAAVGDFVEL